MHRSFGYRREAGKGFGDNVPKRVRAAARRAPKQARAVARGDPKRVGAAARGPKQVGRELEGLALGKNIHYNGNKNGGVRR